MQGTLTNAEMQHVLETEVFGQLACADDGKPYIVPLAYVFHENVIYGQTTEGKKTEMLRKNPSVCFSVQHQKSHRYESVLCSGTFEELDFERLEKPEAARVLELLTSKIAGIQDIVGIRIPFSSSGFLEPLAVDGKRSTLFRIVVLEMTGRFFEAR